MSLHRVALAVTITVVGLAPAGAAAQGCEPIRFTTPVNLGGVGQAYAQSGREWQLGLAYRRLASDEFFVGTEEDPSKGPGGQSPEFRIHTFVADVGYAFNDQFRLRLAVPFSTGQVAAYSPTGARTEQNATGIGDVSLMGEGWLFKPRTHERGNIGFGLGFKAPTGSHKIKTEVPTSTGTADVIADQTIQPGDGGWGILLESQGFHQITERSNAYAYGFYMVSPKAESDVKRAGVPWSVPDVYSARLGASYDVQQDWGLALSLGGRFDGIPVHDLLGGGDETTVKRSAQILYADPGLSFARGKSTFTLSVPYRLWVNREKSELEQSTPGAVNGGGFAKFLVFASYGSRF
jgi:hypothetical protein